MQQKKLQQRVNWGGMWVLIILGYDDVQPFLLAIMALGTCRLSVAGTLRLKLMQQPPSLVCRRVNATEKYHKTAVEPIEAKRLCLPSGHCVHRIVNMDKDSLFAVHLLQLVYFLRLHPPL